MTLYFTNKTRLPKGLELPRKTKKAFKKYLIGCYSTVSISPFTNDSDLHTISLSWVKGLYKLYKFEKNMVTNNVIQTGRRSALLR